MKTHFEKMMDRSIEKMKFKDAEKLIGFTTPLTGGWEVVCADGGYVECETHETAIIISNLEQIKSMLFRLLEKK